MSYPIGETGDFKVGDAVKVKSTGPWGGRTGRILRFSMGAFSILVKLDALAAGMSSTECFYRPNDLERRK